ncbi:MAG: TolC family protein [Deltaproteobacteria bacterium]|nr:TolC family protein [Deltaproteobacteria bacterium]
MSRIIGRVLLGVAASMMGLSAAHADEARQAYLMQVRSALLDSPLHQLRGRPVALSLDECVRLALAHNAKIGASDHAIDAAKAQQREAHARGWPVFEYEYRTAPVPRDLSDAAGSFFSGDLAWFHSLSLKVGIPLYAFGKLSIAQALAERGVVAEHEKKRKEGASAVAKVRQLYYGVQLAEELAGVSQEAIDRLTERIEIDRDEARKKRVSPVEQLRLQIVRAEIEKQLAEARTKQRLALEGLRIQVGLPEMTPVTVTSRALHARRVSLASIDAYLQEARTGRPDARLVDIGVEAKALEYQLERKKDLPDIGVGGFVDMGRTIGSIRGITSTDDFNHPFRYARAGVGVQLKGRFDPHGGAARIRKKRSEYYKVTLERDLAKEGIALEVRQTFLEAKAAHEQVMRADESRELARRMFFLTKSNNELGIGDSREYADAVQMLLMTQGRYFEAVFAWNSALASLDDKIGLVPYAESME